MLQPVIGGHRPDADCPHKFVVETIFTPDGDIASLERLVTNHNISPTFSWRPALLNHIQNIARGPPDTKHYTQLPIVSLLCNSENKNQRLKPQMRHRKNQWCSTRVRQCTRVGFESIFLRTRTHCRLELGLGGLDYIAGKSLFMKLLENHKANSAAFVNV